MGYSGEASPTYRSLGRRLFRVDRSSLVAVVGEQTSGVVGFCKMASFKKKLFKKTKILSKRSKLKENKAKQCTGCTKRPGETVVVVCLTIQNNITHQT